MTVIQLRKSRLQRLGAGNNDRAASFACQIPLSLDGLATPYRGWSGLSLETFKAVPRPLAPNAHVQQHERQFLKAIPALPVANRSGTILLPGIPLRVTILETVRSYVPSQSRDKPGSATSTTKIGTAKDRT